MAKRWIGDAVVTIEYAGEKDGRSQYKGTIKAGDHTWRFADLGSPMGGFRTGSDSPEAYDEMAGAAASFASYYTTHNRGDDVPDWAPSPEIADAIDEAVSWVQDDKGNYQVRRSAKGKAVAAEQRVAAPSKKPKLDAFTRAYIEAMLWSTNDDSDEQDGEPLDKNYGAEDIAPETMELIVEDCADFQKRFGQLIEDEPAVRGEDRWDRWELAGHDFWLTREGHGAGFWDGDWPKHGDELTEASKSYGSFDLTVDDGVIYGPGADWYRKHRNVSELRSTARGPYIVYAITHGHGGTPTSHAPRKQFDSVRAARAHGAELDRTVPASAEISIGDKHGNILEILNRRSGQWHVQPAVRESRSHRVADFDTLPALIEHAKREGGATHVKVAGTSTTIYTPLDDDRYEVSTVWRKAGYWHGQAPSDRTVVDRLPADAQPIDDYLARGWRKTAEGRREPSGPGFSGRQSGPSFRPKHPDKQIAGAAVTGPDGVTYAARMYPEIVGTHGGASNLTLYFRRDGNEWREIAWDSMPKNTYAELRRRLKRSLELNRDRVSESSRTVRDYVAVDYRGRQVGGPFTDYRQAKREADRNGGVVKFAPGRGAKESRLVRSPIRRRNPLSTRRRPRRS
jgi:hypothetical protein